MNRSLENSKQNNHNERFALENLFKEILNFLLKRIKSPRKKKSKLMELMEKDVIDTLYKDEREINIKTSIFLNKKLEEKQRIVYLNFFSFNKIHLKF